MAQTYYQSGFRANWKCFIACFLVAMSPFQYGIDFGLIAGLQAMPGFLKVYGHVDPASPIGYNIAHDRQQLISSLMTLGAFVTSFAAGPISKYMGRKLAMWISCIICIVANVIMMTTTSIEALYVARLVIGFGNGGFMTFSQLYLQECSPARYRGFALSVFLWFVSLGSTVGAIIDNFTKDLPGKDSYIVPLGLIYVIPGILVVGLYFIPESPRWLMLHGRNDEAQKSLKWLREKDDLVAAEFADIQESLNSETEVAKNTAFADMWRDPVERRRSLLAICTLQTQAASGSMFIIAYGTYFFEMAHVGDAFENSCILHAVALAAIMLNAALITRWGRRRRFLIGGLSICAACQLIVAVVYDIEPNSTKTGKIVVAFTIIYMFGYNGMVTTYAWISGGELPSQRMRSYTFGIATALGFLGAWLTQFTAPYFINPDSLNWGPKYGYIWFPSCIVSILFVYFYLPEVKDRTLEEIDEMFEARLPARAFPAYKCMRRTDEDLKEKESATEVVWHDKNATVETAVTVG